MEFMKQFLRENNIPISDENWAIYSAKNVRKEYKKKDLILKKGAVENYLSFVEEGTARLFFMKDGRELTTRFVFRHNYLTSYDSFLQRSPSRCTVEALTDMVVWQIHYDDLQEVYRTSSVGNLIGRITVEQIYLAKSNKEFSYLSESAEERYLKLMKEHPELFQLVALKHIATYLGITPQALSRIRRRIS
ncbi:cyclic nucleotide-binding domain-containing protein [Chryseobacterium sp. KACC 21268]|nr:cyclic nucleotide-binding domain-containing protein [Chryseobacterium sp. KACC 21268]